MNQIFINYVKKALKKKFTFVNLSVIFPDGSSEDFGNGDGKKLKVSFKKSSTLIKIYCNPEWYVPTLYEIGEWDILDGDLGDFLIILKENQTILKKNFIYKVISLIHKLKFKLSQINNPIKSRINVKKHYDLNEDSLDSKFYKSFLGDTLYYSCAFFNNNQESLEQGQKNKVDTIIKRLNINKKNLKILDIGSGWGDLSKEISKINNADVTGITLSKKQLDFSKNIKNNLVQYEFSDYREHDKLYDRIVSIGMYEHVGLNQYKTFWNKIKKLLNKNGLALIHSMIKPEPDQTNIWILKKIFPGGYIPSLAEMVKSIEQSNLSIKDIFIHDGKNYHKTLGHWKDNFEKSKNALNISEEEFRKWYFYFSASQHVFNEYMGFQIAQIVIKKG